MNVLIDKSKEKGRVFINDKVIIDASGRER